MALLMNRKAYLADTTVAIAFSQSSLLQRIQNWVKKRNVDMFELRPDTPDVLAVPHFVSIVDRTVLGLEMYDTYLRCMHEVKSSIEDIAPKVNIEEVPDFSETTPFIIVDSRRDLPYAENDFVAQINADEEDGIDWILNILETAYLSNQKRRGENEL